MLQLNETITCHSHCTRQFLIAHFCPGFKQQAAVVFFFLVKNKPTYATCPAPNGTRQPNLLKFPQELVAAKTELKSERLLLVVRWFQMDTFIDLIRFLLSYSEVMLGEVAACFRPVNPCLMDCLFQHDKKHIIGLFRCNKALSLGIWQTSLWQTHTTKH